MRIVAWRAAFGCLAACGATASGQLGSITVLVDGTEKVVVAPGASVRLDVVASYSGGIQLAGVRGGVRVAGDAGTPSNFVFHLGSGPLINTGAFAGGSRLGMDVASGPPLFFGLNPLWIDPPVDVLSYDLTLETPGVYEVVWEAPASGFPFSVYGPGPNPVVLYAPPALSLQGATITVTPAPTSACVLAGILARLGSRRRWGRAERDVRRPGFAGLGSEE